ncbi:MAG: ribonuclease Z [Candidatus Bilamarchaeaceae archaeon]
MLKITFLGTSGSTPTIERNMPAIALQYEGSLLLWDAGECAQRQMMKYGIGYGSIDAIFISHSHLDHYLGIFGLLETLTLSGTRRKIEIFGFEDFSWIEERYPFAKFSKIKNGRLYRGRDYSISAFPVKHCKGAHGLVFQEDDKIKFYEEKAHALGLHGRMFTDIQRKGWVEVRGKRVTLEEVTWKRKGRKIVYTGDSVPCDSIAEQAKNAEVLIHDATFDPERKEDAMERMHSTMEDAAYVAKRAGVKQLILTHFSPRYPDVKPFEEKIRKIFPNTIFAYDGLTIEVKLEK